MTASRYFSADYGEARARFLDASRQAGALIESHRCPTPGPEGEPLFTDVAWHGPKDAASVLVTISGTHGVEGFCGSGVQAGWLAGGLDRERPAEIALMQIHAMNPYGFAWLRRVTEDNVDLNRNFVDHAAPYPVNPGYEALAEAICPPEWNDAVIAETMQILLAYAETEGEWALREAITAGQYSHPDGIFFGGHQPTWSHRMLETIFADKLRHARQVAVIDYHSGLGPRGHGERISVQDRGREALRQAESWYGDITSPAAGTSSSVEIIGFNVQGMERAVPHATLTAIVLEYGTQPAKEVQLALRAENWLHLHGDPGTSKGRAIKRQLRDAFYQDQDDWKEMVFERAVDTQRRALAGLSEAS
ncbi:MAG: M14 family metallopeptidase [Kiloniellales bacterium]